MIGPLLSLAAGYLVFAVVLVFCERHPEVRRYWLTRVLLALVMGLVMARLTPLWTRWDVVFYNPLLLLSMNAGMPGFLGGLFSFFGVVGFSLWQGRKMDPSVRRWPLVVPVVAGLVVVTLWWGLEPLVTARPVAAPGPALEVLIPDFEGRRHTLSDWKGKVVVVNFWATWCPPCLAEVPEFQSFTKVPSDKVVLVGVDVLGTEKGGLASVMRFASEQKLRWTQLTDADGALQGALGVTSIPTTVVFDPEGREVDRRVGAVDLFWLRSLEGRFAR
jgi:cytochrome c biogenesis protein CcmG/thiol:disulfide interchange protein DsbE